MFSSILILVALFSLSVVNALQLTIQTPVNLNAKVSIAYTKDSTLDPENFLLRARGISDPTLIGPNDPIDAGLSSGTVLFTFGRTGTFVVDALSADGTTTLATSNDFNVVIPPKPPEPPSTQPPPPSSQQPAPQPTRDPQNPPSQPTQPQTPNTEAQSPDDSVTEQTTSFNAQPSLTGSDIQTATDDALNLMTTPFPSSLSPTSSISPGGTMGGVGAFMSFVGPSSDPVQSNAASNSDHSQSDAKKTSESTILILVGVIVGSLAVLALALIFGCRYRKLRRRRMETGDDADFFNYGTSVSVPGRNQPSPSFIQNEQGMSPRLSRHQSLSMPSETGSSVSGYMKSPSLAPPTPTYRPGESSFAAPTSPLLSPMPSPSQSSLPYTTITSPPFSRAGFSDGRPTSMDGTDLSGMSQSSTSPLMSNRSDVSAVGPWMRNLPTPPASAITVASATVGSSRPSAAISRPAEKIKIAVEDAEPSASTTERRRDSIAKRPRLGSQRQRERRPISGSDSQTVQIESRRLGPQQEDDWELDDSDEPLPVYVETPHTATF